MRSPESQAQEEKDNLQEKGLSQSQNLLKKISKSLLKEKKEDKEGQICLNVNKGILIITQGK